MIPALALAPALDAVRLFLSTWWKLAAGAALAAAPCFLLGQCDGRKAERTKYEAAAAKAAAAAETRQRRADAARTTTLQQQTAAIAAARKEVDDATAAIPDQVPTARQRSRACLELRRQAAAAGEPQPAC